MKCQVCGKQATAVVVAGEVYTLCNDHCPRPGERAADWATRLAHDLDLVEHPWKRWCISCWMCRYAEERGGGLWCTGWGGPVSPDGCCDRIEPRPREKFWWEP